MGTYRHILKNLRAIALEHATATHPDLASMARELGRVVHRDAPALASTLASLRKRQRGFERLALTRRGKPPLSVLVVAWPPNHASPIQHHAGSWGLELALIGALEVQTWQRDADSGELILQGRNWLGPGDGSWFEGESSLLRRCRNLSRHEIGLSLHVYGADLSNQLIHAPTRPVGQRIVTPARTVTADQLHG